MAESPVVAGDGLEITADVWDALGWVLGDSPTSPEPVVLLATYLDALAKGYGLSESQMIAEDPLERAAPPAPALPLLRHYLAEGGADLDADRLRDRLHAVFAVLADRPVARKTLNRTRPLTEVELLTAGQVYWNLERTDGRPRLPIRPGPITNAGRTGRQQDDADIPTASRTGDFATMTWTARVNEPGSNKSSGQGFRKQGARLAVLAAQHIIETDPRPAPALQCGVLHHSSVVDGIPRAIAITWPEEAPAAVTRLAGQREHVPTPEDSVVGGSGDEAVWVPAWVADGRLVMGSPRDLGTSYQRRGFDDDVDRIWAQGGDRRVWLRGAPGIGKSYAALRVWHEALGMPSEDRGRILIWVDSADPAAIVDTLSRAMDLVPQLHGQDPGESAAPPLQRARSFLTLLSNTTLPWLVIYDGADPDAVIEAGLVPPGGNPKGRFLATTVTPMRGARLMGRVVVASRFSDQEAIGYVRSLIDPATGDRAPLAHAADATIRRLARAVDHHPLGLSIAAKTIITWHLDVDDWLAEFQAAATMDAAADEPDAGGYPLLIGAAWRVALDRAGRGQPEGVVTRAAYVAAILRGGPHPSWLWQRDGVDSWVSGGAGIERRHGTPVAVQRLIDHGIVEFSGPSWPRGQLQAHQLAARAILEDAPPRQVADLAELLVTELGDEQGEASDRVVVSAPEVHAIVRRLIASGLVPVRGRARAYRLLAELELWSGQSTAFLAAAEEGLRLAPRDLSTAQPEDLRILARLLTSAAGAHGLLRHEQEQRALMARALDVYDHRLTLVDAANVEERAELELDRGDALAALGRGTEAAEGYRRGLDGLRQTTQRDDPRSHRELAVLRLNLGKALQRLDCHEEAAHELATAVEILANHVEGSNFVQALFLGELARSQERLGMVPERAQSLNRVVTLVRDLGPNVPYVVHLTRMQAMEKLADTMRRDPTLRQKGISLLAGVAELASDLAAKDPTGQGFTSAHAYYSLGHAQAESGDHAEAATNLRYAANALDVLVELTPEEDPDRRPIEGSLVLALVSLGDSCRMLEQWEAATTALDRAVELSHRMTEQSPGEPIASLQLVSSLRSMAALLEQTDRPAEATIALDDALRNAQLIAELTAGDQHLEEVASHVLGVTLIEVASLHRRQDRTDEAIEYCEEALKYWKARHKRHPEPFSGTKLVEIGSLLTDVLIEMGLHDRAQQVMGSIGEALDPQDDDTQA